MSIKEEIERQDIIGEAKAGSYQPIRFTRVKYKGSDATYIDIRMYQRGYDDERDDVYYPTKKGFHFPEAEFKKVIERWTITPSAYIHPTVMAKAFELLSTRQFESAVFQAFKSIEIAVRQKCRFSDEDYGVSLIRKAFNPQTGPLTDYTLPLAEREALAHFIAGAYALYKNPCSHKDVEMDFYDAFDRIVVASKIMKIVEAATVADTTNKPPKDLIR
ncbi:MAG TPA: TIGR02391 family protein [Sedimentisphaerales bacterium]|nr:TIGR02391 family protein [Sedimentisphaerales bacterium]